MDKEQLLNAYKELIAEQISSFKGFSSEYKTRSTLFRSLSDEHTQLAFELKIPMVMFYEEQKNAEYEYPYIVKNGKQVDIYWDEVNKFDGYFIGKEIDKHVFVHRLESVGNMEEVAKLRQNPKLKPGVHINPQIYPWKLLRYIREIENIEKYGIQPLSKHDILCEKLYCLIHPIFLDNKKLEDKALEGYVGDEITGTDILLHMDALKESVTYFFSEFDVLYADTFTEDNIDKELLGRVDSATPSLEFFDDQLWLTLDIKLNEALLAKDTIKLKDEWESFAEKWSNIIVEETERPFNSCKWITNTERGDILLHLGSLDDDFIILTQSEFSAVQTAKNKEKVKMPIMPEKVGNDLSELNSVSKKIKSIKEQIKQGKTNNKNKKMPER